jgi:DNA polymerase I-like protein with 3'-5' exonuclease and polymerase domains
MQCNPRRAHTMAPSLMGQGTARDLMMECILRLPAEIAGMLRIQVHDELVFSLPRDRAQELADQIQDLMTFQWAPRPEMQPVWVLNSSTQFGNNWAGCYQGQERLRLVDETTGERFWFWKE